MKYRPQEQSELAVLKPIVKGNHSRNGKPKVVHNSGRFEWGTPSKYVEPCRQVMGAIELDAASSPAFNKIIKANEFYSQENDALIRKWYGNVFLNPPYSRELLPLFISKIIKEFREGHVRAACVLMNNTTETNCFQELLKVSSGICFIRGRIKFLNELGVPANNPIQGQVMLFLGMQSSAFHEFNKIGEVLLR